MRVCQLKKFGKPTEAGKEMFHNGQAMDQQLNGHLNARMRDKAILGVTITPVGDEGRCSEELSRVNWTASDTR